MKPCNFSLLLNIALQRIEINVDPEFMETIIPGLTTGNDKTVKEIFEMLKEECIKSVEEYGNV